MPWPTSVATNADLFIAVNNKVNLLSVDIDDSTGSIPVISTSGFPSVGYISINGEIIKYASIDATNLLGATRGADGSIAAAHLTNDPVSHFIVADHHNSIKDEIISIETYLADRLNKTSLGTEALPSYSFTGLTGHGMYAASSVLKFSLSGVTNFSILSSGIEFAPGGNFAGKITSTGLIIKNNGSLAAPSITSDLRPQVGVYFPGVKNLGLSFGPTNSVVYNEGQINWNIGAAGASTLQLKPTEFKPFPTNTITLGAGGGTPFRWSRLFVGPGTASVTAISVAQDNLGLWQIASNRLGIGVAGITVLDLTNTRVQINNVPLRIQNGTAGFPSLANATGTITGIYWPTSTTLGISISGSLKATFNATGLTMNSAKVTGLLSASATGEALHFGQTQKIKQITTGSTSTTVDTTSSTLVDTGLSATITPTSSDSKILVMVSQSFTRFGSGTTVVSLHRGNTLFEHMGIFENSGGINGNNVGISYLDSPATTSAITYKTQFRNRTGSTNNKANGDGVLSTNNFITLIELEP